MNKTPKPQTRTARLNVRLTKDELDMIVKKSRKCFHGNKTRFLVAAARSYDASIKEKAYADIQKFSNIFSAITTELARQGNNLNQIAHQLNTVMAEADNHPSIKKVGNFLTMVLMPFMDVYKSSYQGFKEKSSHVLNEMIRRE